MSPHSFPNLSHGPRTVAIPGPSIMPPEVLAAMARPLPDIYEGELIDVSLDVLATLPGLVGTAGEAYIAISNGHGGWEMALTNTLSRGDRVLVADCGLFAAVWADMARGLGLDVELIHAADRRAVDPAAIAELLAADTAHTIKAVMLVHVDTASSIRNDIPAVRAAIDAAGHPALLMIDAIASIGCEPFHMDAWGADVTISASQKGLMTPPGLAFVWVGERAWAAHQSADLRTPYWDWSPRHRPDAHYLRYCGTPPVSHLFAIHTALDLIAAEGIDNVWARHAALGAAVRAAVEAWATPGGVTLWASEPSERANSVTTISTGSIDAELLRATARAEFGVTLGIGLRPFAATSFRIGHMGYVSAPSVLGVLGVVESVLARIGAPVGGSGVAAAAAALAAPTAV
ncbi:MAG TPA: aminotransferase class V-fold PLP-dependent enzyme [Ilumatobacter sp.]|nr:aminotransferase class V-fold PLP-dependent enzyme [Ilumatobacter sp.]